MNFKAKRSPALAVSAAAALAALAAACDVGPVADRILPPLLREFAYQPLVFSPVTATAVGYHQHAVGGGAEGAPAETLDLDQMLDDYSPEAVQSQIDYYRDFDQRLHDEAGGGIAREKVSGGYWVDYGVVENRVARALFRLEKEQPHLHDPNFYVELLGRGLFAPMTLEYASETDRFQDLIARLEKLPAFFETAKSNLTSASALRINAAKAETEGLVNLIRNDIPPRLPAGLKSSLDTASQAAIPALEQYRTFLNDELPSRGEVDWRFGGDMFAEALQAYGSVEPDLSGLLEELQADFDKTYEQLMQTAQPIHRSIYGGQRAPNDYALMRDILDVVSDENRQQSSDTFRDRIDEYLGDVRAFMQNEEAVPQPTIALRVEETPPYLRSRFPVGAFSSPPLLAPDEGGDYWITPIPSNWSRRDSLAKLREYNNFKLKIVAVDAYARYVQAALSAANPDQISRLLRNVDGNRAYTRGWVWYLVDSTMNLGFEANRQQFQLNWFKYKLEFLASSILDIRLHTENMELDEAREMLQRRVFMESGAIDSALRSIQLAPTEFALAYVGAKEWLRVRGFYQEETTDFSLSSFHGKALQAGPMPAEELGYLTTNGRRMN